MTKEILEKCNYNFDKYFNDFCNYNKERKMFDYQDIDKIKLRYKYFKDEYLKDSLPELTFEEIVKSCKLINDLKGIFNFYGSSDYLEFLEFEIESEKHKLNGHKLTLEDRIKNPLIVDDFDKIIDHYYDLYSDSTEDKKQYMAAVGIRSYLNGESSEYFDEILKG